MENKMLKMILAPDSFKGTMDAPAVCDIWEKAVLKHFPAAQVLKLPMADGGEGMVDSFLRISGGKRRFAEVRGPLGEDVRACYGILPDGTAVMEMASCAGLPLMNGKPDIMNASTFGVGELILSAVRDGVKHIIMGLGGSATNDMGAGMASALGYRFFAGDEEIVPAAENLGLITKIMPPVNKPDISITAACDVENPLCGKTGASWVFGGQKGASERDKAFLDRGLRSLAEIVKRDLSADVLDVPGSGAAGGLGGGILAFTGGSLKKGIELLLDAAGFDSMLKGADLVITGEGRIDGQSVFGKVPVGISMRAKKAGVPCIALCGSIGEKAELVYDYGITAVFSAVNAACSFEDIQKNCRKDMAFLADSVMRTLRLNNI